MRTRSTDICAPVKTVQAEPFDPANLNPEQLIVAYLVHRIASLPQEACIDLASVAVELATCESKAQFVEISETIREILFPELIGGIGDGLLGSADGNLVQRKQHIGATIKRFREEAGLSQAELAEETGLTQSHISRLESAEHSPSYKTIKKIADALGKLVRDLDVAED